MRDGRRHLGGRADVRTTSSRRPRAPREPRFSPPSCGHGAGKLAPACYPGWTTFCTFSQRRRAGPDADSYTRSNSFTVDWCTQLGLGRAHLCSAAVRLARASACPDSVVPTSALLSGCDSVVLVEMEASNGETRGGHGALRLCTASMLCVNGAEATCRPRPQGRATIAEPLPLTRDRPDTGEAAKLRHLQGVCFSLNWLVNLAQGPRPFGPHKCLA